MMLHDVVLELAVGVQMGVVAGDEQDFAADGVGPVHRVGEREPHIACGSVLSRTTASVSTLSSPYWSTGFTGVSGVIRSEWRYGLPDP